MSLRKLYLDDLKVGLEFVSPGHRLDEAQILAFASAFDPQPFHLDAEAAKATFFQGLAASGWHTAAITMKLLTQSVPFSHGIIGGGGEIAWPTATRPDDVLRVHSRIIDIKPSRSRPDRAMVTVESRTLNQREDLRQLFTAKLIAFKRPE